jgi:hypothetical protein
MDAWKAFRVVKRLGVKLNTEHLVPRLGMSGAIPPLPLYAFTVRTEANVPLPSYTERYIEGDTNIFATYNVFE